MLETNRMDNIGGSQLKGHRIVDGQETMETLFDAPLMAASFSSYLGPMAPAPNGDLWLSWADYRGAYLGYGNHARVNRLDVLDLNTGIDPLPEAPAVFTLQQNQPNPFNPETWISFELSQTGPTRLEVFYLAGQRVRVLRDGLLPAGSHRLRFDARDDAGRELGSGLYFYRLNFAGQTRTGRMLLVR